MIKEFEKCKLVKEGTEWTHYYCDSNKYKTNIKVVRDDSFYFEDGDTLYLEHLAESYFQYLEDKNKLLDFRHKEIVKYFNNAIKLDYIYKFLKKYTIFKKDYLTIDNPTVQETIELIDETIFKYSKEHPRLNTWEIMGSLDPVRAIQKKKQLIEDNQRKKLWEAKKQRELEERKKAGIYYLGDEEDDDDDIDLFP